jgi:hypothetical protein
MVPMTLLPVNLSLVINDTGCPSRVKESRLENNINLNNPNQSLRLARILCPGGPFTQSVGCKEAGNLSVMLSFHVAKIANSAPPMSSLKAFPTFTDRVTALGLSVFCYLFG